MYYITTSRPYTNASPHLGTILDPIYADVYSRFQRRLLGYEKVFFSMGTDEHSAKIADKAMELGIAAQDYVDSKYNEFEHAFDSLDIAYDNFIQSSNPKHKWIANLVWQKLEKSGYIYKKSYEGLYCKGCEDFYSPSQLVNGHCPIHTNLEITTLQEENYFFKLSSLKEIITKYLENVQVNDKSVIAESLNFVADLQDISISRDKSRLSMDWGVSIASDPAQVMYVWFEALITYLTPLIDDEIFDNWQNADTDFKTSVESEVWDIFRHDLPQNLQVIGRDNVKFHLVIWAGMLLAMDLPPIATIIVHGMVNDSQGRKFAKSLGNGVQLEELQKLLGSDGVRFFVLYYCNSRGDTNFDWTKLVEMYNANLANNLGNLVNRITTLIEKHLQGLIDMNLDLTDLELDLNQVYTFLQNLEPENGLRHLFNEIGKINQYLERNKPWEMAKDPTLNQEKLRHILTQAAIALQQCNEVLSLYLPVTSEAIANVLIEIPMRKPKPLFERVVYNS